MNLQPWLEGLFKSNEIVTQYMKRNPLPSGQLLEEWESDLEI